MIGGGGVDFLYEFFSIAKKRVFLAGKLFLFDN